MSEVKTLRPVWKPAGKVHASAQPFKYPLEREFAEPDWRRLPGYKDVTTAEWETALWQRRHTIKNLKELQAVFGALLPESLLESMERDIMAALEAAVAFAEASPFPTPEQATEDAFAA